MSSTHLKRSDSNRGGSQYSRKDSQVVIRDYEQRPARTRLNSQGESSLQLLSQGGGQEAKSRGSRRGLRGSNKSESNSKVMEVSARNQKSNRSKCLRGRLICFSRRFILERQSCARVNQGGGLCKRDNSRAKRKRKYEELHRG